MAFPISQATAGQQARILSKIHLQEILKEKNLSSLRFFSEEMVPFLIDYFVLVNDLETLLGEKVRKGYYDYSFIVFPIHKAFEGYLSGIFSFMFGLPVSKKKTETIGYYLNLDDSDKKNKIESLEKEQKLHISTQRWIQEWKGLAAEWSICRNPLTHTGIERVETLDQAIVAASSMIRKIKTSSDLFIEEFVDPLVERYQREKESKTLSGYIAPKNEDTPNPS